MPHCVACKTTEGVELYKGRFFCPDHRGNSEEIAAKIPFVDPLQEILGSGAFGLSGNVVSARAIQSAEITREYLKRIKDSGDYTTRSPRESFRKELKLRYG